MHCIRNPGWLPLACIALALWAAGMSAHAQTLPLPRTDAGPSAVASASVSAVSLPASLPLRRDKADAESGGAGVVTAAIMLAVLVAVSAGLVWRKRSGDGKRVQWLGLVPGKQPGAPVRTASQALTASASVHVVAWHGEELLLGATAHSVTLLARHPAPSDAQTGGGAQ